MARRWIDSSRLPDVEAGLRSLATAIAAHGITSVAMPPPGCGNGGLSWSAVGPLVVAALTPLRNVQVLVHAAAMPLPAGCAGPAEVAPPVRAASNSDDRTRQAALDRRLGR